MFGTIIMANSTINTTNFHAEVNTEMLDRLLINGENEKAIRKIIGNVMKQVQARLSQSARSALPNDPRQAYKAVKHSVYKRILGGNVSILDKRRAGSRRYNVPEQKKREGRGGNRLPRSQRTIDLMSYYGSDRGFILRFLNSGTSQRRSRFGNRGVISARNWFGNAAQSQMEQASELIAKLVNEEITKHFNNG